MRAAARAMVLGGLLAALLPPAGAAAPERLRLPTPTDGVAIAPGSETVFFGKRGVETLLPGPVEDEEQVEIETAPSGELRGVVVTQRLVVTGLGDFQFKIPGPARTVEALPESESPPGLRRGSVLWQGFSDGEKVLAARMPLFPDQESGRLPLSVELSVSVDGRPLLPDQAASGPLEARIVVRNTSAIPVSVATADADPAAVADALDALRRTLELGERPVPGERGLPESLVPRGPIDHEVQEVEAPFRILARLGFGGGEVEGLRVDGKPAGDGIEALLGGGEPMQLELLLTGRARSVSAPVLELEAEPYTSPAIVEPPEGGSWRAAAKAARVDGAEMVETLMATLWRTARMRQFDAYLGNPDPTGPAETAYRWVVSAAPGGGGPEPGPPVAVAGPSALGVLALVMIALLLALLLLVAWAHA